MCRAAVMVCAKPIHGRDTPTVAGHESGKAVFGYRCHQVVADRTLMLKKLCGHDRTNCVRTDIFGTGCAAAVPVEPSERIRAARFERATKHVAIRHRPSIPLCQG